MMALIILALSVIVVGLVKWLLDRWKEQIIADQVVQQRLADL